MVRFAVGISWLMYALWINARYPLPAITIPASVLYITGNIMILAWIVLNPDINHFRRCISVLFDTFFISLAIYLTGIHGSFMFGALLFMAFGYGFRYGNKYLLVSKVAV